MAIVYLCEYIYIHTLASDQSLKAFLVEGCYKDMNSFQPGIMLGSLLVGLQREAFTMSSYVTQTLHRHNAHPRYIKVCIWDIRASSGTAKLFRNILKHKLNFKNVAVFTFERFNIL